MADVDSGDVFRIVGALSPQSAVSASAVVSRSWSSHNGDGQLREVEN